MNTKQLLAIALTVVMLASAGCAGWGTDGPGEQDDEQNNTTGLEGANDTNTSELEEVN